MRLRKLINVDDQSSTTLQPREGKMVLNAIDRQSITDANGDIVDRDNVIDLDGDIVVDSTAYMQCKQAAGIQIRFAADQPALPWQNPCPECGRPIQPRRPNQRGPSPTVCSERCRKRKQRRLAQSA